MVTYREWMSIGLKVHGSDADTFGELASIWSENEAYIRGLSKTAAEKEIRNL